ncbi:hypothetical protein K493DRAFT_365373 [Basidiobolus meristosporus CBS 931.73]|uniref:Uncharacterized protein n=1 Tax=Basidiobolus meristosporus CBS 931.73 TaxID=1314790 RepID=A0A1Y1VR54_9FUNG|nr:hypothetical protein K493DRAFT_365373 [Basidiobolus meristosporus CBS 931.73]|eukprot:ORX62524.1 hypothetical protein K493DRAFT_365373 [Basidiobolus meristosporus CBS 931.73]
MSAVKRTHKNSLGGDQATCGNVSGNPTKVAATNNIKKNHVDRALLHTDPVYCYNYVAKFVDFSDKDVQAIKSVLERLAPLGGVIVDACRALLQSILLFRHNTKPDTLFCKKPKRKLKLE